MFQLPGGTTKSVPEAIPVWTNHAGIPLVRPRPRVGLSDRHRRRPEAPPTTNTAATPASRSARLLRLLRINLRMFASSSSGERMSTPRCQCARETVASQRPRHSVVISYALHRKGQGAPKSAARGESAEDLSPQPFTQLRGCDGDARGIRVGRLRTAFPPVSGVTLRQEGWMRSQLNGPNEFAPAAGGCSVLIATRRYSNDKVLPRTTTRREIDPLLTSVATGPRVSSTVRLSGLADIGTGWVFLPIESSHVQKRAQFQLEEPQPVIQASAICARELVALHPDHHRKLADEHRLKRGTVLSALHLLDMTS